MGNQQGVASAASRTGPPPGSEQIPWAGGTYEGIVRSGQPDGFGQWIHPDGRKYVGEWRQGRREGTGTMHYATGDKYEGSWRDDLEDGDGVHYRLNGEVFKGTWRAGKRVQGQSTVISQPVEQIYQNGQLVEERKRTTVPGGSYVGPLDQYGEPSGNGTIYYNDGSVYVGFVQKGSREGTGEMVYAGGGKYVGEWRTNVRDGTGRMEHANGTKYFGTWSRDAMHGKGTLEFRDGRKYEGGMQDNQPSGIGFLTYPDGSKYEGQFRDGSREGKGKMTYANGDIYDGDWARDAKEGYGLYISEDGLRFEGTYSGDKRNGPGAIVDANGSKAVGQWRDDQLLGQIEIVYPSGAKYLGEWGGTTGQSRHGRGRMTYINGDVYDGEWIDDRRHGRGRMVISGRPAEPAMFSGKKGAGPSTGTRKAGGSQSGLGGKKGKKGATQSSSVTGVDLNRPEGWSMHGETGSDAEGPLTEYDGDWMADDATGQGKVVYANGDVYEGSVVEGRRTGRGTYRSRTGATITSDWWADTLLFAEVSYLGPDGTRYDGRMQEKSSNKRDHWVLVEPHGPGKVTYADGSAYEGHFMNGLRHGKGQWVDPQKGVFEGLWMNDLLEGDGKWKDSSGSQVYEGPFKGSVPHGQRGKLADRDGREFEVIFENGQIRDRQMILDWEGGKYVGDLNQSGRPHGRGIWTKPSLSGRTQQEYSGDWHDGMRHGKGRYSYENKDVYEGEWRESRRYGRGQMKYCNGDLYEGEWVNDRRDGFGSMRYAGREYYEGMWRQDARDGRGFYQFADGREYDGPFRANEAHGANGFCLWPDGDLYFGDWEKNTMQGMGTYFWPGGKQYYAGQWKAGQRTGQGTLTIGERDQRIRWALHTDALSEWREGRRPPGRISELFRDLQRMQGADLRGGAPRDEQLEVYKGIWTNGVLDGKGMFLKGSSQWISAVLAGRRGKEAGDVGFMFEGVFRQGKRLQGTYTHRDGRSATKAESTSGTIEWPNGGKYKGQMEDGIRGGTGTQIYPDGGKYEGSWHEDVRHGDGKQTYGTNAESMADVMANRAGKSASGVDPTRATQNAVYVGKWDKHKRHGWGSMQYGNGDLYEGYWREDVRHGTGTVVYVEGGRYDGEFVDNRKEGIGAMRYPDGSEYEGDWKDNKRHGWGVMVMKAAGSRYEGMWFENAMHGRGIWRGPDNAEYIGSFVQGAKHGSGHILTPEGRIFEVAYDGGRETARRELPAGTQIPIPSKADMASFSIPPAAAAQPASSRMGTSQTSQGQRPVYR
eukprot:tig00000342_g24201.t1